MQVLSQLVGEKKTASTPFRNIFPTTTSKTIPEENSPKVQPKNSQKKELSTENTNDKLTESITITPATLQADQTAAKDFKDMVTLMLKLTKQENIPGNLSTDGFLKMIVSIHKDKLALIATLNF